MTDRKVVLRDQSGKGFSRSETARYTAEGGVVIEGQDLGPGVEGVFGEGYYEYEWASAIVPSALPDAVAALGGQPGEDLLDVMERWVAAGTGTDVEQTLKSAGVPIAFWSRVGD